MKQINNATLLKLNRFGLQDAITKIFKDEKSIMKYGDIDFWIPQRDILKELSQSCLNTSREVEEKCLYSTSQMYKAKAVALQFIASCYTTLIQTQQRKTKTTTNYNEFEPAPEIIHEKIFGKVLNYIH